MDKTEFIVIASSYNIKRVSVSELHLENDTVLGSNSARNLGVIMDNSLTMIDHINSIRKTGWILLPTLDS